MPSDATHALDTIRNHSGRRQTEGLSPEEIERFLESDPQLRRAIGLAAEAHPRLLREAPELLAMDEAELCTALLADYESFYPDEGTMPYVPLAAAGSWIVTTHGAVVHDSGGYGMLGMGHAPQVLLDRMAEPAVMANVMTPSFSQKRLADRLRAEIGHTSGGCPFHRFICMNSGSEAVAVASRIADINAKKQTDPGGAHEGRTIRRLALAESFHGRTTRPARASHATRPIYQKHLASFRDADDLVVVEPNDLDGLRAAFDRADRDGVFFEALYLEPVLGEGTPGLALTREFYDLARSLTAARGTVLIVDSIQAAIRAQGCLSIVDYPGFQGCEPPDLETYSKALNAGQYPLSVLALSEPMASLYVKGIYGNTMTTNPRALEVACAVLDALTEERRQHIRERGDELKAGLTALAKEHPDAVRGVSGTGLMVNAELDPERYPVTGREGFEQWLRRHGVSMIHGGKNGLRFTPSLDITSAEIDLIVGRVHQGLTALA